MPHVQKGRATFPGVQRGEERHALNVFSLVDSMSQSSTEAVRLSKDQIADYDELKTSVGWSQSTSKNVLVKLKQKRRKGVFERVEGVVERTPPSIGDIGRESGEADGRYIQG